MGDTNHRSGDGNASGSTDQRRLTRRDALGALAAGGVTAVAGCSVLDDDGGTEDPAEDTPGGETDRLGDGTATDDDDTFVESHDMAAIRTLATVLYPSAVEVTDDFLETYLDGRIADGAADDSAVREAVETIDSLAREQYDGAFHTLETDQQESVVTSDVRSDASVADGTDVERLNYHLVDELLFALYASPVGGELVGNPNPRGWPGGYGDGPEVSQ